MNAFSKIAASGALALSLATSGAVAPASAHDHGLGLGLGIASGLIIGGILLNEHRNRYYDRPAYIYDEPQYDSGPVCYPGPVQAHWQQICQPDAYGQLYCRNVKNYYRQQICN